MPHANIWIRKEDWAAWATIEDKPGFIHTSIINYGLAGETASKEVQAVADKFVESIRPPVDKLPSGASVTTIIPQPTPVNEQADAKQTELQRRWGIKKSP